MTTLGAGRTERVRAALEREVAAFAALGTHRWEFALNNGACHAVRARLADEWLLLAAEPTRAAVPLWGVLVANHNLPPMTKRVLTPDRHMQLRAELLAEEGVDLERRVRQACDGICRAWDDVAAPVASGMEEIAGGLKDRCAEAGWPLTERSSGRLTVDLEVERVICQATLAVEATGVRVAVELGSLDSSQSVSRRAAAVLLLEASGLVRMARASAVERDGAACARFEVLFGDAPTPAELSAAFGGLSTACSLCLAEVGALQHEGIARDFLSVRGWAVDDSTQTTN